MRLLRNKSKSTTRYALIAGLGGAIGDGYPLFGKIPYIILGACLKWGASAYHGFCISLYIWVRVAPRTAPILSKTFL
jgi:hypothetical protein